eukprot:366386-Chlamydomonas_euryale.AAC.1
MREVAAKCLQKNPALRPTAAQLLEHKFFKQVRVVGCGVWGSRCGVCEGLREGGGTAQLLEHKFFKQVRVVGCGARGGHVLVCSGPGSGVWNLCVGGGRQAWWCLGQAWWWECGICVLVVGAKPGGGSVESVCQWWTQGQACNIDNSLVHHWACATPCPFLSSIHVLSRGQLHKTSFLVPLPPPFQAKDEVYLARTLMAGLPSLAALLCPANHLLSCPASPAVPGQGRGAKDEEYLARTLMAGLPSLAERVQEIRHGRGNAATKTADNDANFQRSQVKKGGGRGGGMKMLPPVGGVPPDQAALAAALANAAADMGLPAGDPRVMALTNLTGA